MLEQRRLPEDSALLQFVENYCVGVLDEHSTNQRHVGGKLSAKIHGLQERQSVALPRCVVVGAEGRGHVHDTRSLLR